MTGNNAGWRAVLKGIAGVAVSGGLVIGSAATALADPDPTTTTPVPTTAAAAPAKPSALPPTAPPAPTVAVEGGAAQPSTSLSPAVAAVGTAASGAGATAGATGDVIDQLAEDYAVGSGGGQLSNLLRTVIKLRSMGFRPSKQYLDEIKEAMTHRPNQLPLIGALKDTIAYQQKIQAQMQILQSAQAKNQNGAVMGAGAAPGAANPANVAPQATAPGQPAAAAPPVIVPPTP